MESFRDEQGRPRQRTLATIGHVDESGGQVDSLLNGLLRARGQPGVELSTPQVRFESALALGDVWALDQLWHELGFDRLAAVFRRARFTTAVEHAVRVMVFNRLCDADSKLGVLRWLQTVAVPGEVTSEITHQQLLRSMDALMDHQAEVDDCVAQLLRPLIDEELSVVFYDLTTIRAEGLSEQAGDVRRFGMSKEGMIARQFMLGVVQTADGLPIYHEVFEGNTAEAPTLKPTLERVLGRYPHIKRLIVVADRGLLSLDNLEELSKLKLPGERTLEFILAVPERRYGEFVDLLAPRQRQFDGATEQTIAELRWGDHRLVVAHSPERGAEKSEQRRERIKAGANAPWTWPTMATEQRCGWQPSSYPLGRERQALRHQRRMPCDWRVKEHGAEAAADVGQACSLYQDPAMRNLPCTQIQVDEIWSSSSPQPDESSAAVINSEGAEPPPSSLIPLLKN